MTRINTPDGIESERFVFEALQEQCGSLTPRHIVLKPNWVAHETDPAFPIRALVTDPKVIEYTVRACQKLFPSAESILVGDCPLQYADWPKLCQQSGLTQVIERLAKESDGRVSFRDLRQEVFAADDQGFMRQSGAESGDPLGYATVELGTESHLEPLAAQTDKFAVNDYSQSVTSSNHRPGSHRYFVSRSILRADLFINLPKWKCHAKSAITGALKNVVGINGDKAYLPHFRRGAPKWGGDEYRDDHRWLYWAQTFLRERLQKRAGLAYRALKPGWELLKKLRGIETRLDNPRAEPKNFYIAGGAWFGNDTIWRMIYDLNLIIALADADGKLRKTPQRQYFCVVDGLVSGEGNGPLQPTPLETGWLLVGTDPFEVDTCLCHFMGFNPARVPLLAQRATFRGANWGRFDLNEIQIQMDDKTGGLLESEPHFKFAPPPGWRNHVER